MIKSDITVIIPIHKLNEQTIELFDKAILSVVEQVEQPKELLIVGPSDVAKYVTENILPSIKFNIRVITNDGPTDFATQFNLGVANTKTEWFCLLEFDDELSTMWLKNVNKYKAHNKDVDTFLPIVIDTNGGGGFLGFSNEAVWAAEFSTELGIIDNTTLLGYQGFNFDGMVMRKDVYEAHGGLKPSIKLTFIYEFLLRITYFSARVMVIPKFGYRHLNQREGSIFNEYQKTLTADESRWWMNLAKKEYFHTKDRGITYEKKTV